MYDTIFYLYGTMGNFTTDQSKYNESEKGNIPHNVIGNKIQDLTDLEYSDGGWYDFISPKGNKIELKTTRAIRDSGRKGRYRLQKSNHQSLQAAASTKQSYYILVLYNEVNGDFVPNYYLLATPSEVWDAAYGTWTPTSHQEMKAEKRITWSNLFDESKIIPDRTTNNLKGEYGLETQISMGPSNW